MPYCPKCGARIAKDDEFCRGCGSRLTGIEAPEKSAGKGKSRKVTSREAPVRLGEGWLRYAGLLGFLIPVVLFSSIFIAISESPGFDWELNNLSDLGYGPAADVFNNGLMASGALVVVFAAALAMALRKRPIAMTAAVVMLVAGITLFGIGAVPDTPFGDDLHMQFSLATFAIFPISLFVFSADAFKERVWWFLGLSVALALITTLSWTLGWDGIAIPETILGLTMSTWAIVQGVRLLLRRA